MNKLKQGGVALWLVSCLLFALCVPALAATDEEIGAALTDTAAYVVKHIPSPQVGSIGGEWAVIGLARSNAAVPDGYYDAYYNVVVRTVQDANGVLHQRKYSEYSRLILALTAIGKDPANVGGYDLLAPLGDYIKTIWQGINGPIWALIALDSGDHPVPINSGATTQATRELYISYILDKQLADGGWALSGTAADPDMTGMALQALSNYQSRGDVKTAIDKALSRLSAMQDADGGFSSSGIANSESCAQVVVALCSLGIDLEDSRFVKNGYTVADGLLQYYAQGNGFTHTAETGAGNDQLSTEQGLYALTAIQRANRGQNALYDMSDVQDNSQPAAAAAFTDIDGHLYAQQIAALSQGGFIDGMGDGSFRPDKTLTRAEFAALIVKALSLTPQANAVFSDVKSTDWYAAYVGAAFDYGMIAGRSATLFDPQGAITDSEAKLILDRAAVKLGVKAAVTAVWQPSAIQITRGETAGLLYDLLKDAGKL
ncbi:MAG: S-layer homology domain-containing protein [Bacillota bacterium]|nr:S-layer homology domain-containing protein [Bacillota bacterium]